MFSERAAERLGREQYVVGTVDSRAGYFVGLDAAINTADGLSSITIAWMSISS